MVKRILSLTALFLLVLLSTGALYSFVFQEQSIPELKARVTDLTGTLHSNEIDNLESKLKSLEETKGSQLVVVIISSTGDETIEQYGIKLAEDSKIGRGNTDDGVILLVAKDDRQLRIEVGYGLEGAIPDAYASRIINEIIVPQFRSGDFYHGIDQGVDAIISLVNGEDLPVPDESQYESDNDSKFFVILVPVGFILLTLINYFAKKKLGKIGGMFVVPLILLLGGAIAIDIIVGVIAGVFSLIFLNLPRGGSGRGGGRYYSGGGSSWSSGSSSFGGGFSGGGGSFGGGGSSGSW